ncbi:MAG: hypothetical protein K6V97_06070 [Actinomycetia bacterium]|nr:hypothetical protein [Actinomycetes bacterium]
MGPAALDGRPTVAPAENRTGFGGTGVWCGRKARRLHERATRRGVPLVCLADGGDPGMPAGRGSAGIGRAPGTGTTT